MDITTSTTLRDLDTWLSANALYLELKALFDTRRGRMSYRAYLRDADRKIVCVATCGASDAAIVLVCERWEGMQPRESLLAPTE